MGKAGFEIEIGGMQFDKGFENSKVLAVFEKGENEFFRIEAEGQKVLKGKSAYPEIISAPFETKKDIRFFFGIMKKFCMEVGEKNFDDSVAIMEKYAKGEAKDTPGETLKYRVAVRAKNPSIQTNLSIPFSGLHDLSLGNDFEKAKAIADDMIAKYSGRLENVLKRKLLSFFTQLAYQTYVYTENKIIPAEFCYPDCRLNEEMLEDVESHKEAETGTKASSAKLKFDVLIKASQAEVLKELFTEAERETLLAVLDHYENFWGKKFENAKGGQVVYADSYAFATIRSRVSQNIEACHGGEGARFVFTEPRMASIIEIQNDEIVIELRKDGNPVNNFLRDYCKSDKEPGYIENLFPLLDKEYGVKFVN